MEIITLIVTIYVAVLVTLLFLMVRRTRQENDDLRQYLSKVAEQGLQPSVKLVNKFPEINLEAVVSVLVAQEGALYVNDVYRQELLEQGEVAVVSDSLWVINDSRGGKHAVVPLSLDPSLFVAKEPKEGDEIKVRDATCSGNRISVAENCRARGNGSTETVDEFPNGYRDNCVSSPGNTCVRKYQKVGERRDYPRPNCQGAPNEFKLLNWSCD